MKKVKQLTLALGEYSGHTHTVYGDIEVLVDTEDYKSFNVNGKLTHQEHDTMVFEDELVVSSNQVEFDPFEQVVRKVLD